MTNLLSVATNIGSLIQLIALIVILVALLIAIRYGKQTVDVICRVISTFAEMRLSGSKGDTRVDAHLRQ